MKKKTIICIIGLLIFLTVCTLLTVRFFKLKQLEKINAAVFEAWKNTRTEDSPAYLDAIDWETMYRIDDYEKGNPGVITVTVTGVDLGAELRKVDPAIFTSDTSDEEINEYLISLVKQAEKTKVTTYLYAWQETDGIRIEFSESFVDAMSGKVYSYAKDILNDYLGGGTG